MFTSYCNQSIDHWRHRQPTVFVDLVSVDFVTGAGINILIENYLKINYFPLVVLHTNKVQRVRTSVDV